MPFKATIKLHPTKTITIVRAALAFLSLKASNESLNISRIFIREAAPPQ
jgi:hypothetical protein